MSKSKIVMLRLVRKDGRFDEIHITRHALKYFRKHWCNAFRGVGTHVAIENSDGKPIYRFSVGMIQRTYYPAFQIKEN